MADRRRNVGKRRRATDDSESRIDALRRSLAALRSDDDGPQGVDARTVGDNRSAVDARRVDVDDEAADAAGEGKFGDDIPTASGSETRDSVAKATAAAKQRTADELKKRANKESLKAAAKQSLEAIAADEGAPSRAPGTTGTQTEEIAKRATDAASIRAPMGGSLRTLGDRRAVEQMARAGAAEGAGLLSGAPLDFGDDTTRNSRESDMGSMALLGGLDLGVGGTDPRGHAAETTEHESAMAFDDPFGLSGGSDDQDEDDDDDSLFGGSLRLPGGDE